MQVMLPVLEFGDPNDQEGGRHYWMFNINLRDLHFEVLDSWRKLDNPDLMHCASTIAGRWGVYGSSTTQSITSVTFRSSTLMYPSNSGSKSCMHVISLVHFLHLASDQEKIQLRGVGGAWSSDCLHQPHHLVAQSLHTVAHWLMGSCTFFELVSRYKENL